MHDLNLDGKSTGVSNWGSQKYYSVVEPVKVLTGHEKYVSSITYFAGLLVSVSWDW